MILTHCFCNFSLIWSSFGMSRLFRANIHLLQYFYATRGSNLSVWSMEKLNSKSHFWLKFSKISKCLKKYLVSSIYYLKHYSQSLFKSLISIRRELMLFKISICEYIHILSRNFEFLRPITRRALPFRRQATVMWWKGLIRYSGTRSLATRKKEED
jgi:hypothetical protein